MNTSERLFALAKQMISHGNTDYCDTLLEIYLADNSDDLAAHTMLCQLYAENGRIQDALGLSRELGDRLPADDPLKPRFDEFTHQLESLLLDAKLEPGTVAPQSEVSPQTPADTEPSDLDPPEEITWANEQEKFQTKRTLTPYFGFSERPHYFRNNNYGFPFPSRESVVDYPLDNGEDGFVIGIFGGSVAAGFYQDVVEYLNTRLSEHSDLIGTKIKILQFSMGSIKQPQQLFYLSYFKAIGQKLDLVINIDGFNDTRNAIFNVEMGHHYAMPWAIITDAMDAFLNVPGLDAGYLRYLLKIAKIDSQLRSVDRGLGRFLSKFGYADMLNRRRAAIANKPPPAVDHISMMEIQRVPKIDFLELDDAARSDLVDQVVDLWFRSALAMQAICNASDTKYVHAIQPNHYFCSKPLTPEEAGWVVRDKANNRWLQATEAIIQMSYPRLIEKAKELEKKGGYYCHMTDVFDLEEQQVFSDFDCHFNRAGHMMMASKLADFILNLPLATR